MTAALQAWLPLPLLCWLPSDLSVTSLSFYGGLRFQGADLCRNKSTLQLRCRRADDRIRVKTQTDVDLKQSTAILFYSPLSTWAPEALADTCMCVPVRLLSSASTATGLGGDERRGRRIEETLSWAVLLLYPCMRCDFCFMACGCIKL